MSAAVIDQRENRGSRTRGPQLSIVVATLGRAATASGGLKRLISATRAYPAQILVVGVATPSQVCDFAREHPGIQFVVASPGATRADLLSLGIAQTDGGVVVLTDDGALAEEDWPELLACRMGSALRFTPDLLAKSEIPA